jgi:short-subunit dehydrogenase
MSYDFRERVVLITGASSGIGRATAEAFARAGARVVLTARNTERLQEAARQLESGERKPVVHRLDVTDRAEVFRVIERVATDLGRIDILVNNAGIGHCLPIAELRREDVERLVDTNLMGVIHTIQAIVPVMTKQGAGQIVNIASTAGLKGIPMMSVYCATKFAVRGLSESLRMELKPLGIEVLIVNPGTTDTGFFRSSITGADGFWLQRPWTRGPQTVARGIVRACARHQPEVVLTPEGKAMVWLNKFVPRLVDYMTMKVAAKG